MVENAVVGGFAERDGGWKVSGPGGKGVSADSVVVDGVAADSIRERHVDCTLHRRMGRSCRATTRAAVDEP